MATIKLEHLPHYTWEDYKTWEGDWELIQGIPYAMGPSPVKRHQLLTAHVVHELMQRQDACPHCQILLETDWKVDSSTVFRPDISIVCNDDNPLYISKAPEVIFEILSPSTSHRDEGLKKEIYEYEGVKYYVLVYPEELLAKIFRHNGERFIKAADCDKETFRFEGVECSFQLDFLDLFQAFRPGA